MTQHLLLIVVVAPLAVLAWPLPTVPDWARGRAFAAAIVVTATTVLVVWHLPGPYDAAQLHLPLHILEHGSLLGAAVASWWVILASPASVGVRLASCIATAAPM